MVTALAPALTALACSARKSEDSESSGPPVDGGSFHCPAGPFDAPVPPGASAQRIDGVPLLDAFNDSGNTRTNIEGAVWAGDALYVSEFPFTPAPRSRVFKIVPDTRPNATGSVDVSIAVASSGANGLALDATGNLIATDHALGAIVRMPFPLGSEAPTVLVASYEGMRFNSPNDVAVRSDGTIYFSDPDYQAPMPRPQPRTRVYRLAPGATQAVVIDADRAEPNGVTLSIDEHTLYVSGSDGIFSYPVLADGSTSSGSRVRGFSGASDGLAIDCSGNLYATSGRRIVVLSPAGVEIASVPVTQAENVTNVAFGGQNHQTLFITGSGRSTQRGVFRVELAVPGMPY